MTSRGHEKSPPACSSCWADELERDPDFGGDSTLLAAFFISGYTTVLTGNGRRLIAGEPSTEIVRHHRQRLGQLFRALRNAVR